MAEGYLYYLFQTLLSVCCKNSENSEHNLKETEKDRIGFEIFIGNIIVGRFRDEFD